jgi:hypothetical protein
MSRDLRRGGEDVTVAVSYQEIAVRDFGGSSIDADENVHPVVIFPQVSNLHRVQVAWLTQGVDYVFADYGLPLLRRLFLLNPVLIFLLLR